MAVSVLTVSPVSSEDKFWEPVEKAVGSRASPLLPYTSTKGSSEMRGSIYQLELLVMLCWKIIRAKAAVPGHWGGGD